MFARFFAALIAAILGVLRLPFEILGFRPRPTAESVAAAALDVSTTVDTGSRTLLLSTTKSGSRALSVNVDGDRRKLAAGARGQWTVMSVDGWYQATVTVDEDPEFKRVLVGHIENGRTSVSQPT